jgi:hypothetical protein
MNINDFVHYYIGQRCLNTWFPEEHPNYNPGWVLTGFDRDAHRPFKLETEEDFTWTASIKLVLRRLEDMTEDEATHLFQFKPEHEILKCEKQSAYISFQYRWPDSKYNSGYGYSERALGFYQLWKPTDIHYLLKRGFDLFNLIDQNLAEDIKNIQPPQM